MRCSTRRLRHPSASPLEVASPIVEFALSRRRFVVTAGAALASLSSRTAWPQQAVTGGAERAPRWLHSTHLLRTLPRMLELAEDPGLALGVVQEGRILTR